MGIDLKSKIVRNIIAAAEAMYKERLGETALDPNDVPEVRALAKQSATIYTRLLPTHAAFVKHRDVISEDLYQLGEFKAETHVQEENENMADITEILPTPEKLKPTL